VNKVATEAAKTVQISGFRKGKVPLSVIKDRMGKELREDAKNELIRDCFEGGLKELNISKEQMVGEPLFAKFEENENGINFEIKVSIKPNINVDGYKECVPNYEVESVSDDEVMDRIKLMSKNVSVPVELDSNRPLQNGDMAKFDFEGSLDGEALPEATAKDYSLEIGSGRFIPGFEEQMVGMNIGETKEITVKFPADYNSAKLADKDVKFVITLNAISVYPELIFDDELAKRILPNENDEITFDSLKDKAKNIIQTEKNTKLFNSGLKEKLLNNIIEKFNFDLPDSIVDKEIEVLVNQKAHTMSEEELKNANFEEMAKDVKDDAQKSVKATFLIDEIAKQENIVVDDQELVSAIYMEAMYSGRDARELMNLYRENGLLPAVKMGLIEEKLLTSLLNGVKQ
jgi:trigger factor